MSKKLKISLMIFGALAIISIVTSVIVNNYFVPNIESMKFKNEFGMFVSWSDKVIESPNAYENNSNFKDYSFKLNEDNIIFESNDVIEIVDDELYMVGVKGVTGHYTYVKFVSNGYDDIKNTENIYSNKFKFSNSEKSSFKYTENNVVFTGSNSLWNDAKIMVASPDFITNDEIILEFYTGENYENKETFKVKVKCENYHVKIED